MSSNAGSPTDIRSKIRLTNVHAPLFTLYGDGTVLAPVDATFISNVLSYFTLLSAWRPSADEKFQRTCHQAANNRRDRTEHLPPMCAQSALHSSHREERFTFFYFHVLAPSIFYKLHRGRKPHNSYRTISPAAATVFLRAIQKYSRYFVPICTWVSVIISSILILIFFW